MSEHVSDQELWQFPCCIQMKVIGEDSSDFADRVLAVFQAQIPSDYSFRRTPSAKGRFVSLTVSVTLQDKPQLERLYAALKAVAGVKMVI